MMIKFFPLIAVLTSANALSAPLEALHHNQEWLSRAGSADIQIFTEDGSKLLKTGRCDAEMNSSFTQATAFRPHDEAYFSLDTLDDCDTKEVGELSFFDFSIDLSMGNSIFGPVTVDLKQLAEGKKVGTTTTYRDAFFSGSDIYTGDEHSIKTVTHIHEDITETTEISVKAETVSYVYKSYGNHGKSVNKVVTGTFKNF